MDSETVKIYDLTKADFPQVNTAAVKAFEAQTAADLKPEVTKSGNDLTGYNPEIHENPPRKNKRGEWARRRGNKKGFFGKPKTETAVKDEPPPLNVPPSAADEAAAAETEISQSAQTRAAAESRGAISYGMGKLFEQSRRLVAPPHGRKSRYFRLRFLRARFVRKRQSRKFNDLRNG